MRDYADSFSDRELPEKRGVEIYYDIDSRVAFFSKHLAKILFAILLGLFALTVNAVIKAGKNNEQFPLQKINITGELHLTTPKNVNAALVGINQDSFLSIDLDDVSARLVKLPWIASATASRNWPSTLVVNIVEHQPVYRWGNNQLIDRIGNRFTNTNPADFSHLPKLSGTKGSEEEVIQAYKFLERSLGERINDLGIESLVKNKFMSWELHLKSGVVIKFGRDDYMKRATRFAHAYRNNQLPNLQHLNILDFRYDRGFAAKWQPEFQKKNKNGLVKVRSDSAI